MAHVTALFEPRPWYDLVPDQTHAVVTAGFGTFGLRDYVTAARTPNGALVMAYIPSATPGSSSRTVTVDMSRLGGPVTARWYDPAGGTFTSIPGSPFANAGLLNFTTPGINADGPGNEDWVLVLEAAEPPRVSATVIPAGTGSGSVTSSPAGITCGTTCSASFPVGTMITLTATPATGSTFTGWSGGGCSGTPAPAVRLSAAPIGTGALTPPRLSLTGDNAGAPSGAGATRATP